MSRYSEESDFSENPSLNDLSEIVEGEIQRDLERVSEEDELVDGLSEPHRETTLDILKRTMSLVFDLTEEQIESFPLRSNVISLEEVPTRRERMGYQWIPTPEDIKRRVPKWMREVQCPKCGAIMVPHLVS